ncbi:aminotransferase class I/II-fold pyridoxal phosphate-dependent enzyme [Bacteroides caecimuris]|jgi:histidinol-phosphate/aromatic aminotransferase/cobyric acid decarboxylase-like protein/GTP:adenosylcobinamide-phosphate guanylyltransferase|uniref:Aminotransferase n=1 Tax=Bacteroides caecimuris TaxID=1796613 RepID=A0A1C7GZR8_9BACE|nr:aminotransferase class I/II-fold pyridoxal phosphate-dependent enzyme [Bacteroides caecimuris]ANU57864.1 aminotransferase [Bacteroides caecimuris]OXE61704.1 aminotransferase [Bacteroides caecimuris]QQR17269.1 aminotransferase class I/II-fold pyridoxal phosphate-dependent enzyme [Bacteroides caecimuris]TGY26987.1 aminotransferase class I/II-fold pyridoxal phosphate-dependent enzyme [Bacteroides caecimuris]UQA30246.1 aminotransferase class I/II-fold pyridoxal phosphate-dependent enzyme [Bacte
MQAIILAAGMGKRLGEYTKNNTKCMLPVNGVRLIDRMLTQLSSQNLNRVVIVVGYEGTKLIEYIGNRYDNKLKIEYVHNPIYDKTNNIYSLALAKQQMMEDDTLLLESDLIFDSEMLDILVKHPDSNLALVAKYETWMDGTMVRIDDDRNIVNFIPKKAFKYSDTDKYFKTVNIYKFSKDFLRDKYIPFLDAYSKVMGNNEYYENVLRIISFLNNTDLKALPITTEKWYEIDDKQDLDIAEAIFAEEQDILKKYYGRFGGYWRFPKMLDYCYLVNPYFRSSEIIDEMQANFRTLIGEYPSGMKVNTLLASKCWGVKEDYIVPGNGAAELIKALMELLPGKLGITRPTFEEYPNRRESESLVTFIPQNNEYRYSVQDLMNFFEKNPADNILLINPDNPSGNFIPMQDICMFAEWCEKHGIRLIVDESFVDFSINWENNTLLHDHILESYPHMLVMKSISKSYGVPGIRLGILCSADVEIIAKIKKMVSIWNLNSFCEFFMQIYTKYEKDYKRACERFIVTRNTFEENLRQIRFLRVIPSQANYFLVEVLPPYTAREIILRMLKEHNILMRNCSGKEGFDGKQYMRIAIRDDKDNSRFIAALKEIDNNKE